MDKPAPLTDEQLRAKAEAHTLTFDERVEFLVRIRRMLPKETLSSSKQTSMDKPAPLTDEQLRAKAHAHTLTFDERVEYLVRIRGMLPKDALDHAMGPPIHIVTDTMIWVE